MARGRQHRWFFKPLTLISSSLALTAAMGLGMRGGEVAAQSGDALVTSVRTVSGPVGSIKANATIRLRQMRADGQLVRPERPLIAFQIERQQINGRWRTTATFPSTGATTVKTTTGTRTIENPFAIARVEYDEDIAATRAYDRAGRRLAPPTDADRRRFGITPEQRGTGWDPRLFGAPMADAKPVEIGAGGFYADSAQITRRKTDIQQKFGRSRGRLRGFDRYVATEGVETRELLVTPDTNLPVELNIVRDGALASRVQMQYQRAGSAGYVRQSLHSERPAGPSSPGELIVTDLVFGTIDVATGGGR